MYIVELTFPGQQLQSSDKEWATKMERLLNYLADNLVEAAIALFEYENDKQHPKSKHPTDRNEEEWTQDREMIANFTRNILAGRDERSLTRDEADDIRERARMGLYRTRWASGSLLPRDYTMRYGFIYAKMYIFALDNIGKLLNVLEREPGAPSSIVGISDAYYHDLAPLKDVRDSAHHMEDRARGLGKNQKPVDRSPNDSLFGNGMALNNMVGNLYSTLLSNGRSGEVEIGTYNLSLATATVQAVIKSFDWLGTPTNYFPN